MAAVFQKCHLFFVAKIILSNFVIYFFLELGTLKLLQHFGFDLGRVAEFALVLF